MSNKKKIILASASSARKMMLDNAGVPYAAIPAYINEHAIIDDGLGNNQSITDITQCLAEQKALHIAEDKPDCLVIGSDQTLEFNGRILTKSADEEEALDKLKALSGKTHYLHSAVSVVHGKKILFNHVQTATLTMHALDDDFLQAYMARDPDALVSCVGGYKIEEAGAWLFSSVEGDNFTIMGMPLLPLLSFLREHCGYHP